MALKRLSCNLSLSSILVNSLLNFFVKKSYIYTHIYIYQYIYLFVVVKDSRESLIESSLSEVIRVVSRLDCKSTRGCLFMSLFNLFLPRLTVRRRSCFRPPGWVHRGKTLLRPLARLCTVSVLFRCQRGAPQFFWHTHSLIPWLGNDDSVIVIISVSAIITSPQPSEKFWIFWTIPGPS